MEIVFDKASKFYEPQSKVTGTITIKDAKFSDLKNFEITAEAYMDTVSQIRGNMGRPPMDPADRIYFMKKKVDWNEGTGGNGKTRTFSFLNEATVEGEKLLDTYVGVEFSILVSLMAILIYLGTVQGDSRGKD